MIAANEPVSVDSSQLMQLELNVFSFTITVSTITSYGGKKFINRKKEVEKPANIVTKLHKLPKRLKDHDRLAF